MSEDELTEHDHSAIDAEIFLCETCGWWCEQIEMSDEEGQCEECHEQEND